MEHLLTAALIGAALIAGDLVVGLCARFERGEAVLDWIDVRVLGGGR